MAASALQMNDITLEELDIHGSPRAVVGKLPPLSPQALPHLESSSPDLPTLSGGAVPRALTLSPNAAGSSAAAHLPHIPGPPKRKKGARGNSAKQNDLHEAAHSKPSRRHQEDALKALSATATFAASGGKGLWQQEKEQLEQTEAVVQLTRRTHHECDHLLLECWLNDVLTKRPPHSDATELLQVSTSAMTGLSNFGLCRADLLKQGLTQAKVERIYRSLYVYTVGFHDTLKELLTHSSDRANLVTNVWKTFVTIAEKTLKTTFKSDYLSIVAAAEHQASEVSVLRERVEAVRGTNNELEAKLGEILAQAGSDSSVAAALKAQNEKLVKALDAEQASHSHAVQKYIAEVDHRTELQEQVVELRASLKLLQESEAEAQQSKEHAQSELEKAQSEVAAMQARLDEAVQKVALQEGLVGTLQEQHEALKEGMAASLRDQEELQGKLVEEARAKRFLQADMYKKRDRIAKLTQDLENALEHLRRKERQLEEAAAETARIEAERAALEGRLAAVIAEREAALGQERERSAQLHRKRSKKRHWKALHKKACDEVEALKKEREELQANGSGLSSQIEFLEDALLRANQAAAAAALEATQNINDLAIALAVTRAATLAAQQTIAHLKDDMINIGKKGQAMDGKIDKYEEVIKKLRVHVDEKSATIQVLDISNAEAKTRIAEKSAQNEALSKQIDGLEEELEKLKKALDGQTKLSDKLSKELADAQLAAKNEAERLAKDIGLLDTDKAKLVQEIEALRARVADLEAALDQATQRGDKFQAQLEEEKAEHAQTKEALAIQKQLCEQEAEAHAATREELREAQQQVEDLSSALEDTKQQLEEALEESQQLKADLEEKTASLETAEARIEELEGQLEAVTEERDELLQRIEQMEADMEADRRQMQAEVEELTKALADEEEAHKETKAERDSKQAKIDQYLIEMQMMKKEDDELRAKFEAAQKELAANRAMRSFLQGEIGALKTKLKDAKAVIQEKKEQIEKLKKDMEKQAEAMGGDMEQTIKNHMKEMQDLQAVLDKERRERDRERDNTKDAHDEEVARLNQELEAQRQRAEAGEEALRQLQAQHDAAVQQAAEDAAAAKKAHEDQVAALEKLSSGDADAAAKALADAQAAADKQRDSLLDDIAAIQDKLDTANQLALDRQAEIDALQASLSALQFELEQETNMRKDVQQQLDAEKAARAAAEERAAAAEARAKAAEERASSSDADAAAIKQRASALTSWVKSMPTKVETVEVVKDEYKVFDTKGATGMEDDPELVHVEFKRELLPQLIHLLYLEKIEADRADDEEGAFGSGRQTLEEFVYDFFLFKFGMRRFAEAHLQALTAAVLGNLDMPRVGMFSALLGAEEDGPFGDLVVHAGHFFLTFLSTIHYYNNSKPADSEYSEGRSDIPMKAMVSAVDDLFGKVAEERRGELVEQLRTSSSDGHGELMDLDYGLRIVMEFWNAENLVMEEQLRELFLQADANGDGVLTFQEFSDIVKTQAPESTERQQKALFRDALRASESGSKIKFHMFAEIMRSGGFLSFKSTATHQQIKNFHGFDEWPLIIASWECAREQVRKVTEAGDQMDADDLGANKEELAHLATQITHLDQAIKDRHGAPEHAWALYHRVIAGFSIQSSRLETVRREKFFKQNKKSSYATRLRKTTVDRENPEAKKGGFKPVPE